MSMLANFNRGILPDPTYRPFRRVGSMPAYPFRRTGQMNYLTMSKAQREAFLRDRIHRNAAALIQRVARRRLARNQANRLQRVMGAVGGGIASVGRMNYRRRR